MEYSIYNFSLMISIFGLKYLLQILKEKEKDTAMPTSMGILQNIINIMIFSSLWFLGRSHSSLLFLPILNVKLTGSLPFPKTCFPLGSLDFPSPPQRFLYPGYDMDHAVEVKQCFAFQTLSHPGTPTVCDPSVPMRDIPLWAQSSKCSSWSKTVTHCVKWIQCPKNKFVPTQRVSQLLFSYSQRTSTYDKSFNLPRKPSEFTS